MGVLRLHDIFRVAAGVHKCPADAGLFEQCDARRRDRQSLLGQPLWSARWPTSATGSCIQNVWGYQDTVNIRGRQIVLKYDRLMRESGDFTLAAQANDELCAMAKEESTQILNKVLRHCQ